MSRQTDKMNKSTDVSGVSSAGRDNLWWYFKLGYRLDTNRCETTKFQGYTNGFNLVKFLLYFFIMLAKNK